MSRITPEYKAWRVEVLRRDKYKCQYPGCTANSKVQAHHIIPWAQNDALRYDVDNGITLCVGCHVRIKGNETDCAEMFKIIVEENKKNRSKMKDDRNKTAERKRFETDLKMRYF